MEKEKENITNNTHLNESDTINRLIRFASQNNFATAVWRLPNQNTIHQNIDTGNYQQLNEINLEELQKGFLFCPYEEGKKIFIRSDIHYASGQEIDFPDDNTESRLNQELIDPDEIFNCRDELSENVRSTTEESYLDLVKQSIAGIRNNRFQKVVPSRIKIVDIPNDFNIVENFINLTRAYPRAFIFYVQIPEIGSWMGATPETLIDIEGGQYFRTVSLAGTQKYEAGSNTSDIAWTQKEIEEQAMVSRYIINCFKKIRLREFVEKGPKTMIAANLIHLKTTYEVDLKETGFSNLGTVMLNLLHPTSAVCGMPKETAADFIASMEIHSRKYYSGFLGPVDNNHNTHLFVNLRTMELFKNKAVLYAGAGITEDSDPDREWKETELKCNTLLNVIKTI